MVVLSVHVLQLHSNEPRNECVFASHVWFLVDFLSPRMSPFWKVTSHYLLKHCLSTLSMLSSIYFRIIPLDTSLPTHKSTLQLCLILLSCVERALRGWTLVVMLYPILPESKNLFLHHTVFFFSFICCVIWFSNLGLWTRPVRILCDQARDQYWGLIYLRVVPRPQICVKVFIFKNPEGLKLSSSPLCQWGFCLVPVTLGPLALFWSQLLPWFRSTSPSKSNCTSAPACLISLRD